MKFFHLSDLHIGLSIGIRNMLEDQKIILNQIVEAAKSEKPDAIVIAGDLYDRSTPASEAVAVCDDFLSNLVEVMVGKPIFVIAGNHDNPERVGYLSRITEKAGLYLVGNPPLNENDHIKKVPVSDEYGEINFYLLPFLRPSMVRGLTGLNSNGRQLTYDEAVKFIIDREEIDESARNVIVSHQFYFPSGSNPSEVFRTDSEIVTIGNIDAVSNEHLKIFDYAALGHIHSSYSVGDKRFVYCGTPIACSISEKGQKKAIVVVEMAEKGNLSTRKIELIPVHNVRTVIGTFDELINQPSDDYVEVVVTDKDDSMAAVNRNRLKDAFPNHLEIIPLKKYEDDQKEDIVDVRDKSTIEFCKEFASNLSEDDIAILSDIINEISEEI